MARAGGGGHDRYQSIGLRLLYISTDFSKICIKDSGPLNVKQHDAVSVIETCNHTARREYRYTVQPIPQIVQKNINLKKS
jgi:hypothetical protein